MQTAVDLDKYVGGVPAAKGLTVQFKAQVVVIGAILAAIVGFGGDKHCVVANGRRFKVICADHGLVHCWLTNHAPGLELAAKTLEQRMAATRSLQIYVLGGVGPVGFGMRDRESRLEKPPIAALFVPVSWETPVPEISSSVQSTACPFVQGEIWTDARCGLPLGVLSWQCKSHKMTMDFTDETNSENPLNPLSYLPTNHDKKKGVVVCRYLHHERF